MLRDILFTSKLSRKAKSCHKATSIYKIENSSRQVKVAGFWPLPAATAAAGNPPGITAGSSHHRPLPFSTNTSTGNNEHRRQQVAGTATIPAESPLFRPNRTATRRKIHFSGNLHSGPAAPYPISIESARKNMKPTSKVRQ